MLPATVHQCLQQFIENYLILNLKICLLSKIKTINQCPLVEWEPIFPLDYGVFIVDFELVNAVWVNRCNPKYVDYKTYFKSGNFESAN